MSRLAENFGDLADCFPEPILLLESGGLVCAANRAALTLIATLTPKQTALEELVCDLPETVHLFLRACLRSAEPLPGALTFKMRNGGTERYRCQGSAVAQAESSGRPRMVLRFLLKDASSSRFVSLNQQVEHLRREMARRHHAERTAEQQRQIWQVTLSSIGDGVIATDTEGRITFMNAVAESLTGRHQSECQGKPLECAFVIHNEDTGEPQENPVQDVLRSGNVVGLANHTVLIRPDGTQLPIDDSAAPIRDAAGNLFGVVLVFHEVAESRRLQRELVRQAESLHEATRRKDEFLAVLAHELRNPLAPLRNGLALLRQASTADGAMSGVLMMMERQLVHMVRLVNDLMDLNRIAHGMTELKKAPVFIRDVLERSIEAVRSDLDARGHSLSVSGSDDTVVLGDADRLTQVLSNLLTNGIKYSDDGSSIALAIEKTGDQVSIHVTDTGIGIPSNQLEQVFEMFSQVRGHQSRSEGGLGIGLAVARGLMKQHGGTLSVRSEGPGLGSVFTMSLPVLRRLDVPQPAAGVDSEQHSPGPPLRVVVAEDNVDSAESLCAVLQLSGHDVRIANNGLRAVELAEEFDPHVVFMDIGMPEMDGIEATKRIRQAPAGDRHFVVALTGWGQRQDRERTRSAGVDRHVVKPISPEELTEILGLVSSRVYEAP